MLQVREAEVAVAKNLLDHLVQESAHLVAVGEEDVRMEGKLRLLLELVQALDCRVVGNCSHGSLVHRIIVGMLKCCAQYKKLVAGNHDLLQHESLTSKRSY